MVLRAVEEARAPAACDPCHPITDEVLDPRATPFSHRMIPTMQENLLRDLTLWLDIVHNALRIHQIVSFQRLLD